MVVPVTRRAFLASSASAFAALAVAGPSAARVLPQTEPSGPFYARVGARGFAPGSAADPSRGEVVLLDGRMLTASHVASRPIRAGQSVFVVPDEHAGWSILYAEV